MTAKKKTPTKEKVILSALNLAAQQGWNTTSLADIARESGLTLAQLHDLFEDKTDILSGFARMIDRQILENAAIGEGESPRDALFDLLMDRFEALSAHRPGLTAILESFKCDPKQAVIGLPHLARSMSWMLEATGQSADGIKGAVKLSALIAIYLKTVYVWMSDETQDLAKTMAALDKSLARAESWANRFGF